MKSFTKKSVSVENCFYLSLLLFVHFVVTFTAVAAALGTVVHFVSGHLLFNEMYLKVNFIYSLCICIILLLSFSHDDSRMKGSSVLIDAHGGGKYLYRFLKKARFVPIPIIIPVHHKHQ